jgi:hypothetical protein
MSLQNKIEELPHRFHYVIIVIIAALLFIPFLGSVHLFDWDEINFAESAREMLVTGNYTRVQINYQPFWEKPPLFFWMQVLSMKILGVNEFAARFPNAICGIVTLCFIFYIGSKHFSKALGWWWVLAYIGSFLPHFYFKSGIIDPWFNLFIFSGIYFLILAQHNKQTKYFIFSGIATGLAVLTKGPVGLLLVLLTAFVFIIIKRDFKWFNFLQIVVFTLSVFISSFLWYGIELLQNGTWFIKEFIEYHVRLFSTKDSGHGGPFYYHFIILLLGCFPASFFALNAFKKSSIASPAQYDFKLWLSILFFIVLVLFSIVKTKIIHYSSMCYLPLTFLAAYAIYYNLVSKYTHYFLVFLGSLIALVFLLFPIIGVNIHWLEPFLQKDVFAKANLSVQVHWQWWLVIFGLAYFIAVILMLKNFSSSVVKSYAIIFAATILLVFAALRFFVPKVERYSQGTIIDFYKSVQNENAYVEVTGFKSYAQYFYTKKLPTQLQAYNKDWLLTGAIDKPVYMVTKINRAAEFESYYPAFRKVKEGGGFVVYLREPL